MEFLFQFQVDAKEVYYNKPIRFKLEKIELILYLNESMKCISKGKKVHIRVSGTDKNDAYQKIQREIWDFNNRLIFLTGEEILIMHLEFILLDQTGQEIRDIFFRDLHMPGLHELDITRVNHYKSFLSQPPPKSYIPAIRKFNQAILSSLPSDQYKSLYLVLEELVGSEIVEAKCDRQDCSGLLICSECGNIKEYPRVSISRIQEFIDNSYYSKNLGMRPLTAKKLNAIRSKLSHLSSGKINQKSLDYNDLNNKLSLLVRLELEKKFNMFWPGHSVAKYGSVADIDRQFKTLNKNTKFALDIPSIDELEGNTNNTRWVI